MNSSIGIITILLSLIVAITFAASSFREDTSENEISADLMKCKDDKQCDNICGGGLPKNKCLSPGFCSCNENVEKNKMCTKASREQTRSCTQNFEFWNSYMKIMVCKEKSEDICVLYLRKSDFEDLKVTG